MLRIILAKTHEPYHTISLVRIILAKVLNDTKLLIAEKYNNDTQFDPLCFKCLINKVARHRYQQNTYTNSTSFWNTEWLNK